MNNIVLYSTGCPRCQVLKSKLDSKNIDYTIVTDVDEMVKKGIESVPVLEVDEQIFDFKSAVDYVNKI